MKVMVVGGGGREHAIIKKIKKSPKVSQIYALPGNGGIAADATCVNIGATDLERIVEFAKENQIEFAVVAPDDPLVLGLVDLLKAEGIPCFGPEKKAAIIEGSKAFSKELMKKYGIPTAEYAIFEDMQKALDYLDSCKIPVVVKADGLALGKGVIIAETLDEAKKAVRDMMEDKVFGESGSRVVIEEFLTGPEVSVLSFTDGETLRPMVTSMDHKRAYDGNQGPNTGGMGAFCPSPNYTPAIAAECMEKIFLPTVKAMQAEGRPFQGVLYFGLMLTQDGPKVVEYNARFGDPETQPILSMLDTDLMDIFQACVNGTLDQLEIRWKAGAACCIVLASGGYPVQYQSGYPISGLEEAGKLATVFHAGTKGDGNGRILTAGGRVLGVTAVGGSLEKAIETAYAACKPIAFQDMHFRTDIGKV